MTAKKSITRITPRERPAPMVSEERLRAVTPESLPSRAADSKHHTYSIINLQHWLVAIYGDKLMASEQAPSFLQTTAVLAKWMTMHNAAYYGYISRRPQPERAREVHWAHRGVKFVIFESMS
jgi:hypothetical protein